MNSRERINKALSHEETDRVPIDFAGSTWTGITRTAYQHLLKYLGRAIDNPCWVDVIQQLVLPSEEVLDLLHSDTRGLFPLTSHNWDVYSKTKDYVDYLEYKDEWGLTHRFPKNGFWFSLVDSPLKGADLSNLQVMDSHHWPDARNATRFQGLRELALQIRQHDKIVMTKGFCAGLFEMHQRLRGMENAMLDPMLFPITSDMLIGKLADLKIEFWDAQLNEIGDLIDIAGEGDDYGTQQSQLIAPEQFRSYYKPHMERVLKFIKQKNSLLW